MKLHIILECIHRALKDIINFFLKEEVLWA